MLLNSALVKRIEGLLKASLSNIENGKYTIEHDLGPELTIFYVRDTLISHWIINNFYFESSVGSISESRALTCKDIAELLIKLSIAKADQIDNIQDMFNGITTNVEHESPIGLTVKFHCDVDSRRLMISQTANPNNVLYALEEAVNQDMSINPRLMTPSSDFQHRTLSLFSDYLMADLITHDVAI
ncbi:hypothetical protein AH04_39 [Erwinia phage AH04]|uniref:Uncharacterized protein n=1 Tax=Erwinia phage AH04 TaxID=2869569 RepID=A0AAE7X0R1_9CAUD|nr:hypothetical protein PQC02_gp275 [Erwinia phage AH04]QZA70525.1 hypothetical protein AH04_39 [Erwinia phage AH04]